MAWLTESALFSDKILARREGRTWETCYTMNTAAPKSAGRSETIVLTGRKLPADPPITTILMLPDAIYALLEEQHSIAAVGCTRESSTSILALLALRRYSREGPSNDRTAVSQHDIVVSRTRMSRVTFETAGTTELHDCVVRSQNN